MYGIDKKDDVRKLYRFLDGFRETFDDHKKQYPKIELTKFMMLDIIICKIATSGVISKLSYEPIIDLFLYAILKAMECDGTKLSDYKINSGTGGFSGNRWGNAYTTGSQYIEMMDDKYDKDTITYYVGFVRQTMNKQTLLPTLRMIEA